MVTSTNNRISDIVASQLPQFVREDHETFVRFIESYYEYMEQEGKMVEQSKNLLSNYDIDQSIDAFTDKMYDHFLKLIPADIIADKNLLTKHIQDFYKARGTEKSIQFLLRILYNKEAEFYYPKRDILRASDGKWFIEKSVRIGDIKWDGVDDDTLLTVKRFANTRIMGASSGASAIVEKVDVYYSKGVLVNELKLSAQYRDFVSAETISANVIHEGSIHTLSGTVFSGFISAIEIIDGGEGYEEGTLIPVTAVTGSNGVVEITSVTKGSITTIGILGGGAGFQVNNFISFSSLSGSDANAWITAVNTDQTYHPNSYNVMWQTINTYSSSLISAYQNTVTANGSANSINGYFRYANTGPVAAIAVLIGGNNYSEIPVMDIMSNTLIHAIGALGRMEIIDGGLGYTTNDYIQFINVPGGYGYRANANVISVAANGKIQAVKFQPVAGFNLGGEGFSQQYLPRANVVTATGNGANIMVTAILGDGEVLLGRTDTIGTILDMVIVSGGSGYDQNEIAIDMTGYGDGTALANAFIVSGVYSYPGRYLNDDGFLSGYNFLQDASYYQNYSYVVRVNESINKYRKALKDLIHPMGMKLFGEYTSVDETLVSTIEPSSANNTTGEVIYKTNKSWKSTGNTLNQWSNVHINYINHGLAVNSVVYLDFYTGDTANIIDGYYTVQAVANANVFNVVVQGYGSTGTGVANVGIVV
jgi:hypothetical protein